MKIIRHALIALGSVVALVAFSWIYTTLQLTHARSDGRYSSVEDGMLALVGKHYPPDCEVKILYAGPNSLNRNQPFIWYVIAEVHASSRADGSPLGSNGCEAPGTFFLQTKDGKWVHVPEQAFPRFIGFWMKVFDLNGEGRSAPTTNWPDGQPNQFCR